MKIEWLIAAEDDLREIARRVAVNFGEDTAERVVKDVVDETARLAELCEVDLQPCNAPHIYARSIYSPAEASAYMRARFAAMQRHPAPVRGENAEMKQQIEWKHQQNGQTGFYQEVSNGGGGCGRYKSAQLASDGGNERTY